VIEEVANESMATAPDGHLLAEHYEALRREALDTGEYHTSVHATTAFGWSWMRGRVLRRESNRETRTRLLRTEISALLAVAVLEITTFLQGH